MSSVGSVRGLESGKRPALIISECQRGILDPSMASMGELADQASSRGIFGRIAALSSRFREVGAPVVHVHIGHRSDFGGCAPTSPLMASSRKHRTMIAGTPETESMPEIAPHDSDFVSSRLSGLGMWFATDLDAILRNEKVDTLVFVGVSTNIAIFGGALGGVDRGYQCVIAEDCTAGATADTHAWMVTNALPMLATITTGDAVAAVIRPQG